MMQQDFGVARFTRRDAIRVLAAGTGLGALSALTGGSDLLAGLQRTGAPGALTRRLPRGSIIRTLLRDVPPEALGTGAVLFHEHLSINLGGLGRGGRQGAPPLAPVTDNVDLIAQLVNKAGTEGVSCIVDGGHTDMGRKLDDLRTIGRQTNVHIVESTGLRPDRMAIGHTCCLNDPQVAIIKEIARRGAFVGFDRVTTVQQIMPDEQKVAMALALLDAGHSDKLLLSADFTGQRTLDAGPGYGRTLTVFVPMLRKAGVDEATLHTIVYDNPRRFLAFVRKKTSSSID